MYITITAEISKDKYHYNRDAKSEIMFEIDDTAAEQIIATLGPLMQAAALTALTKFRNPPAEEE